MIMSSGAGGTWTRANYETRLHAKVPRVRCREHGVKTVPVPWAAAHSRFTLLFEGLAIAWLKEATPAAVARRLGLTREEANGIVERAVRRGLAGGQRWRRLTSASMSIPTSSTPSA
jgi:hypothetical protein